MLGLNALLCAIIEEIFKALVRKRFDHEKYCNLMGYICQKLIVWFIANKMRKTYEPIEGIQGRVQYSTT